MITVNDCRSVIYFVKMMNYKIILKNSLFIVYVLLNNIGMFLTNIMLFYLMLCLFYIYNITLYIFLFFDSSFSVSWLFSQKKLLTISVFHSVWCKKKLISRINKKNIMGFQREVRSANVRTAAQGYIGL